MSNLKASRFELDESLAAEVSKGISPDRTSASMQEHRATVRKKLLATSVRVDPSLLPNLSASFQRIAKVAELKSTPEAYVFEDSSINAFVTRGKERTFIGVSSGAVNILNERELEFVIGHEMGHSVFGHVDFDATQLLMDNDVDLRQRMQFHAWKRACEISADRFGLICCQSIDVAASAMFRTLSGIAKPDLKIGPEAFAQQWDHLLEEVIETGDAGEWQITHPFPPLRMKAMVMFWESDCEAVNSLRGSESKRSLADADKEISRLLATMDPMARDESEGDLLLIEFLVWGGLGMALADGEISDRETEKLRSLTSKRRLDQILETGKPTLDRCLKAFGDAVERREKKLRAMEVHRILHGLLLIAYADGGIESSEEDVFCQFGEKIGIRKSGCELIHARFLEEVQGDS